MPRKNFPTLGELQNYDYLRGVITSDPDSNTDTCSVRVKEARDVDGTIVYVDVNYDNIPIYYHCENDSALRENGAIEGAAAGFALNDSVAILKQRFSEGSTETPELFVFAHIDGIRRCYLSGIVLFRVWDWDDSAYRHLFYKFIHGQAGVIQPVVKVDGTPLTQPFTLAEAGGTLADIESRNGFLNENLGTYLNTAHVNDGYWAEADVRECLEWAVRHDDPPNATCDAGCCAITKKTSEKGYHSAYVEAVVTGNPVLVSYETYYLDVEVYITQGPYGNLCRSFDFPCYWTWSNTPPDPEGWGESTGFFECGWVFQLTTAIWGEDSYKYSVGFTNRYYITERYENPNTETYSLGYSTIMGDSVSLMGLLSFLGMDSDYTILSHGTVPKLFVSGNYALIQDSYAFAKGGFDEDLQEGILGAKFYFQAKETVGDTFLWAAFSATPVMTDEDLYTLFGTTKADHTARLNQYGAVGDGNDYIGVHALKLYG